MVQIIVDISPSAIARLEEIGRSGNASGGSGYSQDFTFCLRKAIEEFIIKYKKE